ncbi:MAG: hypothetical protein ACM3Q2_04555 [Syntrophothermus sp.]
MKNNILLQLVLSAVMFVSVMAQNTDYLKKDFQLGGTRSSEVQYYKMESGMMSYALNGDRTGTDVFRLWLKCVPAQLSGKEGDEYTCLKFTYQPAGSPESEIPVLKNWSYVFKRIPSGRDEKGQVFGIDHSKFDNLKDAAGKLLPTDKAYHVYNAFIDFHSIQDVFSAKMENGAGIQDLNKIGQKIVHLAANSEAPVDLGGQIQKGSVFRNGKITLELKGISIVNDKECALLEYDSGESSFKMKMTPMPEMEINTTGASHYKGDIYVSTATNWVQKASLSEMVVSETLLPFAPNKINMVIERSISINNVNEKEMLSTR